MKTVQQVEEQLDDVDRRIFGEDQHLSGGLRVTCTEIFLNGYLSPFLWSFLERHSDIEIGVICTDSQLSLGRRDADLAIRFTRRPIETLAGHRPASVAYGVYASRGAGGDEYTPANRAQWDWIGTHDDTHNRILFGRIFPEGRFKHRVDSVLAMKSMARSGLGVTVLPCYIADRDEGLPRLELDASTDNRLDLWVLHHPDISRVYRVRPFADYVADLLKSDLDLFEGRRPLP